MPITEHQRRQRHKHIGASDDPRIIGVSPHGGIDDVYHEKTMPLVDDEPTVAMQTGNRLENPLIDFAREELGVMVTRNQFRVAADGILSANHDALVVGRPQGIQAKYVGPTAVNQWGEPGTDQVPTDVVAQVQHEMYVSDLELVWIPVFIARYRPAWEMYCVPRDQEIIDGVVAQCLAFWNEHVLPRVPPDPEAPPPIELLRRLRREPGSVVELGQPHCARADLLERAKERLKAAQAIMDEHKKALIAALGEAEGGHLPDGRLVTYLEQSRREYVCRATTFRVLKIKQGAE